MCGSVFQCALVCFSVTCVSLCDLHYVRSPAAGELVVLSMLDLSSEEAEADVLVMCCPGCWPCSYRAAIVGLA